MSPRPRPTGPPSSTSRALEVIDQANLVPVDLIDAETGQRGYLLDSAVPIVDVDGACVGAVLVFCDIADRRRAEQERERLAQVEVAQAESRRGEAAREELLRASDASTRAKDEFLGVLSPPPLRPVPAG